MSPVRENRSREQHFNLLIKIHCNCYQEQIMKHKLETLLPQTFKFRHHLTQELIMASLSSAAKKSNPCVMFSILPNPRVSHQSHSCFRRTRSSPPTPAPCSPNSCTQNTLTAKCRIRLNPFCCTVFLVELRIRTRKIACTRTSYFILITAAHTHPLTQTLKTLGDKQQP